MRPRRTSEWWFFAAIGFVAVGGLFGAVFLPPLLVGMTSSPDDLAPGEWAAQISDARQVVLFAAGGLIALLTLVVTFRRDQLARRAHELEVDANFTNRYTRAIDQLGDVSSVAVRLGGITALRRLAEESPRDREAIIDLLSRWIRSQHLDETATDAGQGSGRFDIRSAIDALALLVDVAARTAVNLAGADLRGVDLLAADLRGFELSRADFTSTELTQADLSGATLVSAEFSGATLTDATLTLAMAHWARFPAARLRRAILHAAQLPYSDFTSADLRETMLTDAFLAEANLSLADLGAADLRGTFLDRASLVGADLRVAQLSPGSLTATRFDHTTTWPEGFDPPPTG